MLIFSNDKYSSQQLDYTISSEEDVKPKTTKSSLILKEKKIFLNPDANPNKKKKSKRSLISKENKDFLKSEGFKVNQKI